ncbi:MAG: threonine/serine dehydratase [Alphaproteobacteria bacterium]|nr:MAG: threonine/serine dehydratase [Alphaproteobacteria bacterium]
MAESFDPTTAPTLADIHAAAERLAGVAVTTPVLSSPVLDARLGGRLLVKAEPLQRTGSFKFRGAYNRIALIPEADRARGVVAFSSGNHAQGVAAAAQMFGIPAVIIMPADAPQLKIANTRSYGADVILYDRATADPSQTREAIGARLAAERGLTLVRPYDDAGVIAGQGTVGLELAAQAQAMGLTIDAVVICCSGGGLAAGVAMAVTASMPMAEVWTAEPVGFDDMARSLATGERVANDLRSGSLQDSLMAVMPGEITFPLLTGRQARGAVVSDAEAQAAMRDAFFHLKLVVEPGGAAALAAALSGKVPTAGRTVAVIASGGNVDVATYCAAIAG